MVAHPFFYQLVLIALVWLCLMLDVAKRPRHVPANTRAHT